MMGDNKGKWNKCRYIKINKLNKGMIYSTVNEMRVSNGRKDWQKVNANNFVGLTLKMKESGYLDDKINRAKGSATIAVKLNK